MTAVQSPCLPPDILELVISELSKPVDSSLYTNTSIFSSLSLVSLWFRRLANKHRFSTISLRLRHLPPARVHKLLQVLQSDVWNTEERPVVHVYTLSILFSPDNYAHAAMEDGSLSVLLKIIFQRDTPNTPVKPFTLQLLGHSRRRRSLFNILSSSDGKLDWNSLTESFVSELRKICASSRLTNLNLIRLRNVPLELLSGPCVVESLMLDIVTFSQHHSTGLPDSIRPYSSLRELSFHSSPSFISLSSPSFLKNLGMLEYRFELSEGMELLAKLLENTSSIRNLSLYMSSTMLMCTLAGSLSLAKLHSLTCLLITLDIAPINAQRFRQETWCPQLIDILDFGPDSLLELLTLTFRSSCTHTPQNLNEGIDQLMLDVGHKVFDAFLSSLSIAHKLTIKLSFSLEVKDAVNMDLPGLKTMAQLRVLDYFHQTSRALSTNFAIEVNLHLRPQYLSSFR